MKALTPALIGTLNLKNRIFRSATNENFGSTDGLITERLIDIVGELAENEVGCIITAHYAVSNTGRANINQPLLQNPDNASQLEVMAKAAHAHDAKLIAQLSHAGPKAPPDVNGIMAAGPSATDECRELSSSEIADIVSDFAKAAKFVMNAGFDGVQVHCAHGYLYSSFIDPATNKRSDEYGGSVSKRCQIAIETIQQIKKSCGADFPVFVKINANSIEKIDYTEALIETAKLLEDAGADCIEVSGFGFNVLPPAASLYFLPQAISIREAVSVPVALVGGIHTAHAIEEVAGSVDFVSMSRPFICEPDFIPKLKSGAKTSKCIRCNKCYTLPMKTGKRCVFI